MDKALAKLLEACEAVQFGFDQLLEELAEVLKSGRLPVVKEDDRSAVGITAHEADRLLSAYREVKALVEAAKPVEKEAPKESK